MRYLSSILLCILFLVNPAIADERKTIFEGFDAKIVSVVDDMTDEKSGVIFLDFGPIYMAICGHDCFIIRANTDDLHFAFDETHLIRVGKNKPFSLKRLSRRNGLSPTNAAEAESVIKSLVRGEEVKIRYYKTSRYYKVDRKIHNRNLAFIYHKAAKQFGWKDFGISAKLAPVKLDIYIPTDPDSKGYASVTVNGNRDLGLKKNFDKYGGGCYISLGPKELFGIREGKWSCSFLTENDRIIIRDSQGEIVFAGIVPYRSPQILENLSKQFEGTEKRITSYLRYHPWPLGAKAAKAAWESAPLGSIEIEGSDRKRVLLYGFKELWKWGIDNAGFPSLD